MQDSKQQGLDSYARNLIHHKARQLIGQYGYTWDDYEDLCQEMILDLLTRLPRFDPGKASLNTFVTRVVDRKIVDLVRSRSRAMRDYRQEAFSLDDPEEQENADAAEGQEASGREEMDLRLDLSRAISALPPDLKLLAELLLIHSIAEIARELGVSRSKLYDKGIAPVRRALEEKRLTAYLTTIRRFDQRRRM